MGGSIGTPYIPPTTPKPEPMGRCKRSCCFSPYGHIVRTGCTCHQKPQEED